MRHLLLFLGLLAFHAGPAPVHASEPTPRWAVVSEAQRVCARRHGVPVAFENHLGMRFVLVPEGSFSMGMPAAFIEDLGWSIRRSMPRTVHITTPYYLQTTEVTVGQYARGSSAAEPGTQPGPSLPKADIRFHDLAPWLARISASDPGRRRYRLPTEAEWERACRAETTTAWYWGNDPEPAVRHEHMALSGGAPTGPREVGALAPNPFGIHDMLGNVAEWVSDRFAPISTDTATDPAGPWPFSRTAEAVLRCRVARGGVWSDDPFAARAWRRHDCDPSLEDPHLGFCVALDLPGPPPRQRSLRVRLNAFVVGAGTAVPVACALEVDGEEFPLTPPELEVRIPERTQTAILVCQPPREYCVHGERATPFQIFVHLHPEATALVVDLPLVPAFDIEGTISLPRGVAASGVRAWVARIGDMFHAAPNAGEAPAGAVGLSPAGTFRIGGIPWIAGAPLEIVTLWRDAEGRTHEAGHRQVLGPEARPQLRVVLALEGEPPTPLPPISFESGGYLVAGPLPAPHYLGRRPARSERVRVRCLTSEGAPVPGALVARGLVRSPEGDIESVLDMALANDEGIADFPAVPEGTHRFELVADRVPKRVFDLEVKPGRTVETEIRAPATSTVRLVVRRPEGGTADWARLALLDSPGPPWWEVGGDGEQRVGCRLDAEGQVLLSGVPPAVQRLVVDWHGREQVPRIRPAPGEQLELEIWLPPAPGWPDAPR
jgi:formylglycine-generating enzyme required for sulfatase activity